MDNKKFGEFIMNLRKEKGLTQKELANLLFLTSSSISKWERGLSFPDISLLEPLANVLEVSVAELLKGEKIKKENKEQEDLILKTISISKKEIKNAKSKTKKIIFILIVGILIICFSFVMYQNVPKYDKDLKYVKEYVIGEENIKGEVNKKYFEDISPDFAIGANKYGYAVFKDPKKAFKTMKEKYKKVLKIIKDQYCHKSIKVNNFYCYENLGWQITKGNQEEKEEASFVSSFLDIYDNSFSQDYLYHQMYQ